MKKNISVLLIVSLILCLLVGCGNDQTGDKGTNNGDNSSVTNGVNNSNVNSDPVDVDFS